MKKSFGDLIKLALPMNEDKRKALSMAAEYLDEEDQKTLKYYVKMDKCFPKIESFGTSKDLFEDREWPLFKSHLKGKELQEFLTRVNKNIEEKSKLDAFLTFAPNALERIEKIIAPNIVGMKEPKLAAALQLFASEPFHLLLLGDPGTGKTDILRSVHEISPISSFGLGSGVSGVGLSAAAKGDDIIKGLLPLADNGIACIDELNLIKGKDLAALYNAMEKGFISYDKGTTHETLSAKVRVCATANPAGQSFVGQSAEVLRKQIQFGDALLSRFHLLFIVRKPTEKEFEEIAKKIVKGKKTTVKKEDAAFLNAYIKYAQDTETALTPAQELEIVEFVKGLKKDEKRFLSEIGPRMVVGVVRIAKASARSELSTTVEERHLREVFPLIENALYVRVAE